MFFLAYFDVKAPYAFTITDFKTRHNGSSVGFYETAG